jgi:hypothetical protein
MALIQPWRGWSGMLPSGVMYTLSVMPTRTMLYYAYWTNVDTRNTQDFFFEPPWICAHFPADDGHHVITMNGPVEVRREIKDLEAFYLDKISSIPLLWSRLKNANQVSDVHGSPRLEGFTGSQLGQDGY